jgi:hypothetical protein
MNTCPEGESLHKINSDNDNNVHDTVNRKPLTSTPIFSRRIIMMTSTAASVSLYLLIGRGPSGEQNYYDSQNIIKSIYQQVDSFIELVNINPLLVFSLPFIILLMLTLLGFIFQKKLLPSAANAEEAPLVFHKYYAQRISIEEFYRQAREYSHQQIRQLTQSQAYKDMMQLKGYEEVVWNWQKRIIRP